MGLSKEEQFTKGQRVVVKVANVNNGQKHNERLTGEVIDTDQNNFTLKFNDGGKRTLAYKDIIR